MINWRTLLDDIGVHWRDSGKNVSKSNIVCACPWCGDDDPSEHLAISEIKDAYFCQRNPSHAGKSLNRLLIAFGLNYEDIATILINYTDTETSVIEEKKKPAAKATAAWEKFKSAAESQACLSYLGDRGFSSPAATCRTFDLRFAEAGTWAQRLLLPLVDGGAVKAWTGRAVRPRLSPKYLTEDTDLDTYLYIPRSMREVVSIVEGPMDALKIAAATSNRNISSIALLGKSYYKKLNKLTNLLNGCKQIYLSLDPDVPNSSLYEILYELESRIACPVSVLEVPYGLEDPGAMEFDEINNWIME